MPDGRGPTPSVLYSFPEGFLTHAPRLVELRLRVPVLRAFPPSFLGHAPRLEILELEGTHDYYGNLGVPITSLPANFLIHAPRLQHLELGDLEYVKTFPPGFLSGSPQLRYLNLDANGAATLPGDFLTRHPQLEIVRILANNVQALPQGFLSQSPNLMNLMLDLQRVEALPENFLAETSRLWNLELGVHRVEALPPSFLADAPHLTYLYLRALNLTVWPADFLAHALHIQTLGLAMPLLEPTLMPDHHLWNTLQSTSDRVKVIRPDFHLEKTDSYPQCIPSTIKLGDILGGGGTRSGRPGQHVVTRVPLAKSQSLYKLLRHPLQVSDRCPVYGTDVGGLRRPLGSGRVYSCQRTVLGKKPGFQCAQGLRRRLYVPCSVVELSFAYLESGWRSGDARGSRPRYRRL